MRVEFRDRFDVPLDEAFAYFQSPEGWVRLFGFEGEVLDKGGGWYSVPLRQFPIPLLTRVDESVPGQRVHWVFRGFWRGEGEVNFERDGDAVWISGFEDIRIPRVPVVGAWVERRYLQRPFERLWESGWRRLRKQAETSGASR